jgi:hypothetical protein
MGVEEFRVGGSTGGWKMLFGELAELGEGCSRSKAWPARHAGESS